MKRQQYPPIVWLSAGIGITLMLIALVAAIVLPRLLKEENVRAVASPTTEVEAILSVVAPTAIPTFTPSLTLPPSATPTASLTPTPTPTPSQPPTETPTSTPTITPTSPPQLLAELDTRLFLGPARDYPEQGWLTAGSRALILGRLEGDEWWYVETQLGIKGWAQAGTVAAENDLSIVPVITPLPRGPASPPPTATPAPLIGPLILDEIWPVQMIACQTHFEFDLWIRAHGGTGVYTYLIDDEVIAQDVVDDGITERISRPAGAWVGIVSVISGGLRVDRDMYFAPADWCD